MGRESSTGLGCQPRKGPAATHLLDVYQLRLIDLSNGDVVLGRNRESAHVCVDLDCSHQTVNGLLGVSFLECVAGVHKAGGCVVLALELQVQLRSLAERVSSSTPVFGHFEHVCCSGVDFTCFLYFG